MLTLARVTSVARKWECTIHNASRPRQPTLLTCVLVCQWKTFPRKVKYEFPSIDIRSKSIPDRSQISPRCHPTQPTYHQDHTLVHIRAGSERRVVKRCRVGAKWAPNGRRMTLLVMCFATFSVFPHPASVVYFNDLLKNAMRRDTAAPQS